MAGCLLVLLAACSEPNTHDWTNAQREAFLIECLDNDQEPQVCRCTLEVLEEGYTDPDDFHEEEQAQKDEGFFAAVDSCSE